MAALKPVVCKWCGVACMDYRKGYLARFKNCKCPGPFPGLRRKIKRAMFKDNVSGLEFRAVRILKWPGRGKQGGVERVYAMCCSNQAIRYVTRYRLLKDYTEV